jgi:hypothetical protein
MANTRTVPMVPVELDEYAIAEDLRHLPTAALEALDSFKRELERNGEKLPLTRLKACEEEGRDGTRLRRCAKTYVPWPNGPFGLVLVTVEHPTRAFGMLAFAYGVRHPAAHKLSVYQIADRRLNADSA